MRIDAGGDRPLRPRDAASLGSIHLHDYLTEDGLIHVPYLLRVCHVIQLRDAMRSQVWMVWRVCAGSSDDSGVGELANGNMIRMPIRTAWIEGHDNIRSHPT